MSARQSTGGRPARARALPEPPPELEEGVAREAWVLAARMQYEMLAEANEEADRVMAEAERARGSAEDEAARVRADLEAEATSRRAELEAELEVARADAAERQRVFLEELEAD